MDPKQNRNGMKLTFWPSFIYLTVALILQILLPIDRYIFMGLFDLIFATSLLSNRCEIKPGELLVLVLLFVVNNNRSDGTLDILGDVVFVLLAVARWGILQASRPKRMNRIN
jgi:hypothetical protein